MKVCYVENRLTAKEFNALRTSCGMLEKPLPQVQKALENGLFSISVFDKGTIVGMGRLVGDGSMYWYVQDVAVLPPYQGQGIGKEIMLRLIHHVKTQSQAGTVTTIGLMAAKGKEGFYTKLGFHSRPNEKEGPGMLMLVDIP